MAENTPTESESMEIAQGITYFQETMDKFISTADVSTVYARPVKQGETIIIPTAEVICGLGFGFGMGQGMGPQQGEENKPAKSQTGDQMVSGSGVGGGGGGYTFSRPVALIVATQDEVRVMPVVDRTKILLAAFTTVGFMAATLMRFTRGTR